MLRLFFSLIWTVTPLGIIGMKRNSIGENLCHVLHRIIAIWGQFMRKSNGDEIWFSLIFFLVGWSVGWLVRTWERTYICCALCIEPSATTATVMSVRLRGGKYIHFSSINNARSCIRFTNVVHSPNYFCAPRSIEPHFECRWLRSNIRFWWDEMRGNTKPFLKS